MGLATRRPGCLSQWSQVWTLGSGFHHLLSVMMMIIQSVLAPGFFTMASNVVTSSFKDIHPEMARWNHGVIVIMMYYDLYELWSHCHRWKKEYMATSHKVILAETLSPTFVGLTFQVILIMVSLPLSSDYHDDDHPPPRRWLKSAISSSTYCWWQWKWEFNIVTSETDQQLPCYHHHGHIYRIIIIYFHSLYATALSW